MLKENMKTNFNGLDLLKFLMALVVVMIHVKPNEPSELLNLVFTPLIKVSVPLFFVISSFLFFLKLNSIPSKNLLGGGKNITHFVSRSAKLYLAWFIIDLFYVIARKPYIQLGFPEGVLEFFKDLFLGSTFPGSWFISALVVAVTIIFFLSKIVHPIAIFLVSLLISAYTLYPELFPANTLWIHQWYELNIRPEINLSFPYALVWISMGQLIALFYDKIVKKSKILVPLSLVLITFCYLLDVFANNLLVHLLIIYVATASFFVYFALTHLADSPVYKHIRNYSILIFLFHFSIAGKKALFLSFVGESLSMHWIYYLLVIGISICFAQSVLFLEKKKYLSFLRYLH